MADLETTNPTAPTGPDGAACPMIRRGPVTVDYLRVHPTVSAEQTAGLVGVSRSYVYEMIRKGEIDAIKLGEKRFRVKSASLLRLLGEE
ncbi:helix-turn-helix domain-containing protein [Mycolicibacterium sp. 050232]|uniref:helix-turn-helix domain-containing protein n=1 Tax=Mycolicibacterium sp. 050232 TaxID=3113982 RepID=UPI002E2BE5D2|nr:helix-turn-helix domain-containing protein [Mycolicibacterium sp. 050232]MED5812936.1 helix-turn-helix domain-containing protein [Mycolicibacterium sp. 050232]